MTRLLMPKATAVWLVDNTSLTFDQIADFCDLHTLQVKGIADGDVDFGIKGMDPVSNAQLTRVEIDKGEKNPAHRLQILQSNVNIPESKARRRPKYTPVSKRQDRPDAISWLLRNHAELTDGQVQKLVGTTKTTIQSIRDRSHWNSTNIKPVDPVSLGLCSQIELDDAVKKAASRRPQVEEVEEPAGETLRPLEETLRIPDVIESESVFGPSTTTQTDKTEEEVPSVDSVFSKLKDLPPPPTDEPADS